MSSNKNNPRIPLTEIDFGKNEMADAEEHLRRGELETALELSAVSWSKAHNALMDIALRGAANPHLSGALDHLKDIAARQLKVIESAALRFRSTAKDRYRRRERPKPNALH